MALCISLWMPGAEVLDDEALEAAREDRVNAIATKAMRCSFERSKMVFNRR
jgi:hypothetical protein